MPAGTMIKAVFRSILGLLPPQDSVMFVRRYRDRLGVLTPVFTLGSARRNQRSAFEPSSLWPNSANSGCPHAGTSGILISLG